MIFSPKNLTCNFRNIALREKLICYSAALKKGIYLGTWSGSFHEKWEERFLITTSLFFHVISLLFNNNRRYKRAKKVGSFHTPGALQGLTIPKIVIHNNYSTSANYSPVTTRTALSFYHFLLLFQFSLFRIQTFHGVHPNKSIPYAAILGFQINKSILA